MKLTYSLIITFLITLVAAYFILTPRLEEAADEYQADKALRRNMLYLPKD